MKIRRATTEDITQLYDFCHRMYPERTNYKEIVNFWLSKGAEEINNIIVAVDDDGKIRGQQFFSSMSYYRDGMEINSTWAFDLIVDEELRAGSQGFSLMWKCKKEHPNSMSSGSNETSLPINLKIGNKHIGDLKKFVGITNPLWLCTSFFKGNLKMQHFPTEIKVENVIFKKVTNPELLPSYTKSFNSQFLEISRKHDFLSWRFFTQLHDYVFYKCETSDDYFVVRTIVKKHLTTLVLIDYRCPLKNESSFKVIMKAFTHLASALKIFMIIVGSSLTVSDKVCQDFQMRAVGRDRPILGMIDCEEPEKKRMERDFICLTLADTDGDITW